GAYRPVRRWIAPSRFVRDKVVEWGADPDRIRVLPHGVASTSAAGVPAPAAAGAHVLYAGRLSDEKGGRLLPALALARAPVPLLVAGTGPLVSWLAAQGGGALRMLGHLDPAELAVARRQAGVIVAPSLFPETFGYAVAEAQADAGLVVAARIGALPEL